MIKPEALDWLWEKRLLLGKLNIVYGDPGLGKTTVVLDVLAHVTTGRPFCDGAPCKAGSALFVTAEDGLADTIRPRMDAAGADAERVYVMDLGAATDADGALDLTQLDPLEKWLKVNEDVRVVAIDPLAAFLGKTDSHRNNEVRAILGRLAAVAAKHRVAILAIDHLAKGLGKAVYRGIGSIAFTAAARAVWHVTQDPDDQDRRLFLPVKCNLAKVTGLAYRIVEVDGETGPTSRIDWEEGEVTMTADEAAERADDGGMPRDEAKQWLRDLLKKGPYPAKDLEQMAKHDGICLRTLKYAKKELGVVSERRGGLWVWTFPEKAKKVTPEKAKGVKS